MITNSPRFVTGSIWRHVITMTLTNSIGLMALFLVDLIDLYFLNLLGEQEMAAAVGFSGLILFFITAISIGILIAVSILVSQRIGAKKIDEAKRVATSALVIAALLVIVLSSSLYFFLSEILILMGAKDYTLELSTTYAKILLPSSVILVIGMGASAVLRAIGEAKKSMNVTLIAAATNLLFDPLLIFYFDMGIAGAAWASVLSRTAMVSYALYCVIHRHQMLTRPRLAHVIKDFSSIGKLAGPAMLTNLATPIGSTFVTATIAKHGDSAVAAYATIGRIIPVAFSVLFALSGAISPIIGQNYGAKQYERIKETYHHAIIFSITVVISISMMLFFGQNALIDTFNLSGEAAGLLRLFCHGIALFFVFDGILFSTNAVFNSLGYPLYSTYFNYAKFFFGVIPAVWLLSIYYGASGVIIGQATGPIMISIFAIFTCRRVIANLGGDIDDSGKRHRVPTRSPLWASSSSRSQI